MKRLQKTLWMVSFSLILVVSCQVPQKPVTKKSEKVFYPPAPDIPRLQFLKSFSDSDDLGPQAETVSGFEKFIVGAEKKKVDTISKPYGIAIDNGKLYVCDVDKRRVEVLDLKNKTFGYLTQDRRLANPVDLYIDGGIKYVADNKAGAVFVYAKGNQLKKILGKEMGIQPIDVAVRDNRCYVADMASNQVVVLDINTDQELLRMGSVGDGPGQFVLIAGLTLDADENVYVTDKALARVTKFNKEGIFQMSFGQMGDTVYDFVRPKGISVDKAGRMWIVDAAPQVTKIYDPEGQVLMFFGLPGGEPGNMNLPTTVIIDYDHVDLFKEYFAEGAQIECLILVANQYGQKINVYGFGKFPLQEQQIAAEAEFHIETMEQKEDALDETEESAE